MTFLQTPPLKNIIETTIFECLEASAPHLSDLSKFPFPGTYLIATKNNNISEKIKTKTKNTPPQNHEIPIGLEDNDSDIIIS